MHLCLGSAKLVKSKYVMGVSIAVHCANCGSYVTVMRVDRDELEFVETWALCDACDIEAHK